MPIYRKISRGRLRMVLEGIEDHRRGYRPGGQEFAGMRVPRNTFWIEHIMPQSWETAWKVPTAGTVQDRAQRINSLGNLTLLTAKLNTSASNGAWFGPTGKKAALTKHDVLLLNRDLAPDSGDGWTDDAIIQRTETLIGTITDIWPVPPGYKSSTLRGSGPSLHSVDLSDLLSAGLLSAGQTIIPRSSDLHEYRGQILPDGRIDVDGKGFRHAVWGWLLRAQESYEWLGLFG